MPAFNPATLTQINQDRSPTTPAGAAVKIPRASASSFTGRGDGAPSLEAAAHCARPPQVCVANSSPAYRIGSREGRAGDWIHSDVRPRGIRTVFSRENSALWIQGTREIA